MCKKASVFHKLKNFSGHITLSAMSRAATFQIS